MSDYGRVTISLPKELLRAVDEKLTNGHESRSAVIRRLIEDALRDLEEREAVEQYIRGWRENPQTEEEFGWAEQIALEWAKDNPY